MNTEQTSGNIFSYTLKQFILRHFVMLLQAFQLIFCAQAINRAGNQKWRGQLIACPKVSRRTV